MSPARTNTIVLVEDNPDDLELTVRALKQHHVANEVLIMRDGAEVLEYIKRLTVQAAQGQPVLPQVMLLDLKLPKVDGLEVLAMIRGTPATRLMPVVVLTSSKEERDLIESYNLGANSYIRKPVDFVQFSEAIRQLGLYWMVLNEGPPPARAGGA